MNKNDITLHKFKNEVYLPYFSEQEMMQMFIENTSNNLIRISAIKETLQNSKLPQDNLNVYNKFIINELPQNTYEITLNIFNPPIDDISEKIN